MLRELNKYLSAWQFITERRHKFSSEEVEDESEGDTDGEGGQSLPEERQEHQGEAQPDQDGDEAGQGGVPVPVAARLAHEDAVEDKVPEAELDAPILLVLLLHHLLLPHSTPGPRLAPSLLLSPPDA